MEYGTENFKGHNIKKIINILLKNPRDGGEGR